MIHNNLYALSEIRVSVRLTFPSNQSSRNDMIPTKNTYHVRQHPK